LFVFVVFNGTISAGEASGADDAMNGASRQVFAAGIEAVSCEKGDLT